MANGTRSFDVAVVGAGAAGLAAAAELAKHGRSVCILEARDRLIDTAEIVENRCGQRVELRGDGETALYCVIEDCQGAIELA